MSRFALSLSILALAGCPAPEVNESVCAPICDPQVEKAVQAEKPDEGVKALELTAFEHELLGPILEDVRKGVRAFDDQSVGICPRGENARNCEEMLGTDPGELPEGEYMLYGSFTAPQIGERGTWKVKVETECTTVRVGSDGSESSNTSNWEREFDILYTGTERGYTLSPIRRIMSPNKGGAQSCTFNIHSLHPDHPQSISGAWKVPAEES